MFRTTNHRTTGTTIDAAVGSAIDLAGSAPRTRRPWQVGLLSVLTTLLVLVTSYGAIYFSFFFENPDPGPGSWVFVAVFLAINVTAAVALVSLRGGSVRGWRVLIGYGVVGILWCIAKLVFWQETEALAFGVVNAVCLALLAAPRTRRYVHAAE